ncbi:carboxylating nicotinate-nucleotide diphosphorylase [Salibacterium aidingense]|uniref:carboxylating nicotinate-nucleotide diphosphorylase n=1 Tax=Salibacterium aidingense TaxID=384933 RepID=UPI003BEB428E
MNRFQVREKIKEFFHEDIGIGDLTTEAVFSTQDTAAGSVISKETGIFCGAAVFEEGWKLLDPAMEVTVHAAEGTRVSKGEKVLTVKGPVRALLSGERVLLNIIQRMCGTATETARLVQALDDSSIQVCDTRKTMPGLRMFDKYAVRCGGGVNHRLGLYDAVMLKDNHIAAAGSITAGVANVKERVGHMVKIEVETTSKEEVQEAVQAGADVIMFDNCSPEQVKKLAALVPEGIITEASGMISIETIAAYRGSGVDYISAGAVTHSVQAHDLSLVVEEEKKL